MNGEKSSSVCVSVPACKAVLVELFPSHPMTEPSGNWDFSSGAQRAREPWLFYPRIWETLMDLPVSFQLSSYGRKTGPPCSTEQLRCPRTMAPAVRRWFQGSGNTVCAWICVSHTVSTLWFWGVSSSDWERTGHVWELEVSHEEGL